MDLTALGLQPGELIALVGAGEKSRAAWHLLRQLVASGERAVFTTTMWISAPRKAPLFLDPRPNPAEVARALTESPALVL
ncbi:MAG TPA: hypothetical protein EYH30_05470, partial [Anaerolineales bacterium]|nr:hypothetical protein [Anaerolineales bacterium]